MPEKYWNMLNKLFRHIMFPEVYESGSYDIATAYASIGETEKATPLLNHLIAESENYIDWAFSLGDDRIGMVQQDCLYRFWQWNQCNELLKKYG